MSDRDLVREIFSELIVFFGSTIFCSACLEFKLRFDENSCRVFQRLEAARNSCLELCSSSALHRIVGIVLAVGNFMNNSPAGVAGGFELSFLSKLADTKSANEKSTLLHYIALLADRNKITVCRKERKRRHV